MNMKILQIKFSNTSDNINKFLQWSEAVDGAVLLFHENDNYAINGKSTFNMLQFDTNREFYILFTPDQDFENKIKTLK